MLLVELVVELTLLAEGPLEVVEFTALVLALPVVLGVPVVAVVPGELVAADEVMVVTVSPPSSMGSLLSAESAPQAVRQAQSANTAPRRIWRLVVDS